MPVLKPENEKFVTVEEYLEMDRNSTERHEYYEGQVFLMVGASPAHNLITTNIAGELRQRLKGGDCKVYSNAQKISNKTGSSFFYPDIFVQCGKPVFYDDKQDVIVNPKLIIEVLSPSTKDYDRGQKFLKYQQTSTLIDYILVSQEQPEIEHRYKQNNGIWALEIIDGLERVLKLNNIEVEVPLSEIYLNVFDETESL